MAAREVDASNPALPQQEAVVAPMAIEFVTIAPGPLKTTTTVPGAQASGAQLTTDTRPGASRPDTKIAPEPDGEVGSAPEAVGPTESGRLRMRDFPQPHLDPTMGSGLAAAIASARGPAPEGPRSDLLGGPAPRSQGRQVWRPTAGGNFRAEGQPFEAEIARDGRIVFRDKPNVDAHFGRIKLGEKRTLPLPILAGSFDVTDAVMASLGEVLYPYRKMKLMDQSREERAAMAVRYRDEVLEAALAKYKGRLSKLWRNPEYGIEARKKILFALWDECAEKGPERVVSTARSIRAMTLQFIRRKLPPEHASAYTDAELASLNEGRQSSIRFAPYPER